MAQRKIGVGIIGGNTTGWAASAHVPALRVLDDYEIVAVSTSRMESALAASQTFGVGLAFDEHRALIARPEVDLVVVSVKVPFHFELAMAAIEQGKNLLCEWPLGNGLDEAIRIADAARAKSVVAAIGLQARSSPTVSCVRRLIAGGYVGRLLSTSVIGSGMFWADRTAGSQTYMLTQENGASMLAIACGHMLDAFCFTLGEFSSLVATTAIREPTVRVGKTGETMTKTVVDQVAVSGSLQDGATASFHYRARPSNGTNFYWEINGTDGDLVLEASTGQFQYADISLRGAQGRNPLQHMPLSTEDRWVPAGVADGPPLNVAQAYALLAKDLRNGSRLMPRFEDAVVRHRMLDAIERAAASGTRQSYLNPVRDDGRD
jgi:predicted dehydrogenase